MAPPCRTIRKVKTGSIWRQFFKDPSQWWDNRNRKASARSPEFKHKMTAEALWLDCRYNPTWVFEELRKIEPTSKLELSKGEPQEEKGAVFAEETAHVVALLKTCAKQKDLFKGTRLHEDIRKRALLERSPYVACTLITMYAKCGAVAKAQQVLDECTVRNRFSWTALIAGYARNGHGDEALKCFDKMRHEGHLPDSIAFTCALNACASLGALDKGEQIHDEIVRWGLLEKSNVLSSALVDMYAKCGALGKAQRVLEELPVQAVDTWNALIAGYAKHGQGKEALKCFEKMRQVGYSPTAVSFICALKACADVGALDKGEQICDEILRLGWLEKDSVLCNCVVNMYAKCGALGKAQEVLDELPIHNVVSWNALIAGYAQHGQGKEALKCFEKMRWEGHIPDAVTFTCALKACADIGALDKGEQICDEILRLGWLEKDSVLGNCVVNMFAKCGALGKAQEVLDELPIHDVVSWNALIAGYAQHGQGKEALKCFEKMQWEGHIPDAVTFTCALKACADIGAIDKGKKIHEEVVRLGLLEGDNVLGSAVVDMYAKCGMFTKAWEVLDELPARDVVSWSALIAGYAQHGQGKEALKCFEKMQLEGHIADAVTFICALKACADIGAINKGKEIHEEIVRLGLLEGDFVLGNALVDMYAKCGMFTKAWEMLDELPVRNVVSWNALIAGYAQHGQGKEALKCFEKMRWEGHIPDAVTFICALKACADIGAIDKGKEIHEEIVRLGLLEGDFVLGNALVDMYAKCGMFTKAWEMLDELPGRHVVSWNALIAGYAQHGQGKEALKCFEKMRWEGHIPDAVTFICALKACADIGAIDKGKEIHEEIVRLGLLKGDDVLGNALVNMYAKCGAFAKAREVLDELPARDVVSWSALIAGYASHGRSADVLECFEQMQCEGVSPNPSTFVSMLNACSHSGLLDEGQMYFTKMSAKFGVTPDVQHHCCMVDLFGRAGEFNKALAVIEMMPSSDHLPAWMALLSACRKWKNVRLGRLAFDRILQIDKTAASAYVCMANIYAAAGMQEEAGEIEVMQVANKAWKKPGCCWWIDGSGNIHSFLVRDKKHPQSKYIYKKLQDLTGKMSREGYSPSFGLVSQNISDDMKKDVLCGHSEKLAIACALINTSEGSTVSVIKNMRVCNDCHRATALISEIEKRKIVVRDANRIHIFEHGKCSCKDYW